MPYTAAQPWFGETLRAAGWEEVVPFVEFRRGHQTIIFDTSNWIELSSDTHPRIADLPVPERGHEQEALIVVERSFAAAEAATS